MKQPWGFSRHITNWFLFTEKFSFQIKSFNLPSPLIPKHHSPQIRFFESQLKLFCLGKNHPQTSKQTRSYSAFISYSGSAELRWFDIPIRPSIRRSMLSLRPSHYEGHILVIPSANHLLSCSKKAVHLSGFKTQRVNSGHLEKSKLISEEFF